MNNKIYTFKKKKEVFQYGYGILTNNPTRVTDAQLNCYRNIVWVLYDGWWYKTKFSNIKEFENHIKNTPIYSAEQAFEFIYQMVY